LLITPAGGVLRLYLSAWKNPHPEKKVASLDYVSMVERDSAPFCVAITVEEADGSPSAPAPKKLASPPRASSVRTAEKPLPPIR
jgi:hypothetical protein